MWAARPTKRREIKLGKKTNMDSCFLDEKNSAFVLKLVCLVICLDFRNIRNSNFKTSKLSTWRCLNVLDCSPQCPLIRLRILSYHRRAVNVKGLFPRNPDWMKSEGLNVDVSSLDQLRLRKEKESEIAERFCGRSSVVRVKGMFWFWVGVEVWYRATAPNKCTQLSRTPIMSPLPLRCGDKRDALHGMRAERTASIILSKDNGHFRGVCFWHCAKPRFSLLSYFS